MSRPSAIPRRQVFRAVLRAHVLAPAEQARRAAAQAELDDARSNALETDLLAFGPDVLAETARAAGLAASTSIDDVVRHLSDAMDTSDDEA
jgi:hypothetical protein